MGFRDFIRGGNKYGTFQDDEVTDKMKDKLASEVVKKINLISDLEMTGKAYHAIDKEVKLEGKLKGDQLSKAQEEAKKNQKTVRDKTNEFLQVETESFLYKKIDKNKKLTDNQRIELKKYVNSLIEEALANTPDDTNKNAAKELKAKVDQEQGKEHANRLSKRNSHSTSSQSL